MFVLFAMAGPHIYATIASSIALWYSLRSFLNPQVISPYVLQPSSHPEQVLYFVLTCLHSVFVDNTNEKKSVKLGTCNIIYLQQTSKDILYHSNQSVSGCFHLRKNALVDAAPKISDKTAE